MVLKEVEDIQVEDEERILNMLVTIMALEVVKVDIPVVTEDIVIIKNTFI